MNSSLVPTRIVNKNGVATTVYKAPATPNPSAPMPAPAITGIGSNSLQRIIKRLNHTFGNWNISLPTSIHKNDIFLQLETLPEATRKQILESSLLHPDDEHFDSMVISLLHLKRSPMVIDDCLYYYDNTANMEMATINHDWTENGYDVAYCIESTMEWVRNYNGIAAGYSFREGDVNVSLRDHDEMTRAQVVALIDFINFAEENYSIDISHALFMPDERTLHISDAGLVQLLVDKAPRYNEIIDTIVGRKTLDADLIRGVLDNSAQQMNSGVL